VQYLYGSWPKLIKQTPRSDSVDWNKLLLEANEMRREIACCELLTKDDLDKFLASKLTFGLVRSVFARKIEGGQAIFVFDDHQNWQYEWAEIRKKFGIETNETPEGTSRPPHYLFKNHFAVVQNAIQSKKFDNVLLDSWTALNRAFARFMLMYELSSSDLTRLLQKTFGAKDQSLEVQKIWYAHWVKKHAPKLDRHRRDDAGQRLAELCCAIDEGRILPWGPYEKNWYKLLLNSGIPNKKPTENKAHSDEDALRDIFNNLSKNEIEKLIAHIFITRSHIPPLDPKGFQSTDP
jgi:hypothetical protein